MRTRPCRPLFSFALIIARGTYRVSRDDAMRIAGENVFLKTCIVESDAFTLEIALGSTAPSHTLRLPPRSFWKRGFEIRAFHIARPSRINVTYEASCPFPADFKLLSRVRFLSRICRQDNNSLSLPPSPLPDIPLLQNRVIASYNLVVT